MEKSISLPNHGPIKAVEQGIVYPTEATEGKLHSVNQIIVVLRG